ncbi:MAG: sodium/solute symporter [Cytophagaceae bacterium]|jgi:Na+/proline symporter|nr:sodium/solute symporter [Cytophagaceae bacterium]
MSLPLILTVIGLYFSALLIISWYTSKNADSESFFTGKKESPWFLVAFGMIGTSLSGLTFISVPGAVGVKGFSYYQIILGHMIGYFIIATVLMPLYYRLNLVSIYTYLDQRFGRWSYKTGSGFFLLARTIGSALRLYMAAAVLQVFIFKDMDIPFSVTVAITLLLIWLYTYRGGVKTIIWTDSFQTIFLIAALIISILSISHHLHMPLTGLMNQVADSKYSTMFHFENFLDGNYFWKQLLAGALLALVMTGLDQDLMQKNLSCRNIGDAQKNMFWFCLVLLIVNLLFLTLGALLYIYTDITGIPLPDKSDYLFPMLALNEFGTLAGVFFLLGIMASSFASSDSALTALTTSFCIDFLHIERQSEATSKKWRTYTHIGFSALFFLVIVIFYEIGSSSVIYAVFDAAAYTYGPLLGLFSFGILCKRSINDKWTPYLAIASPLLTFVIQQAIQKSTGYKFSAELLLINGGLMAVGLWISGYFIDEKSLIDPTTIPKTDPKILD